MAVRFLIQGRVQGVGYRQFVHREASRLGLSGFVRNLADGSVECVADGSQIALEQLEGRLRKGPSFSEVQSVNSRQWEDAVPKGFRIS